MGHTPGKVMCIECGQGESAAWLLCCAQEGVLEPLLELFYTREDSHDGDRSAAQPCAPNAACMCGMVYA
jgi:hypothetical protein